MKGTFASFAFGCRVNEAEKVVIDTHLIKNGLSYDEQNPDIYIINSCAVTGKAVREVKQFIYQTRKKYPKTKIVVTGCAATQWVQKSEKISGVDKLISNTEKINLVQIIEQSQFLRSDKNIEKYPLHSNRTISESHSDKFTHSGRFMIKIQDGCNRFCAFCIVPFLRGKPSSRSISEIITDIKQIQTYASEVILTAINTEYFGIDKKETIPELLESILNQTKIQRISFGSINPWSLTDHFMNWYHKNATNPRFVHFFHIPIQSGSNSVLKRMNRGYSSQFISEKLNAIHQLNPQALIGTDVIVGFPGETDQEFQETNTFLEKHPISKFHTFRYSTREGTKAYSDEKLWGKISDTTKKLRSQQLIKLGNTKYQNFTKKIIGTMGMMLILNSSDSISQEGLLENQILVNIPSHESQTPGQIIKVKVIKQEQNNLIVEKYNIC